MQIPSGSWTSHTNFTISHFLAKYDLLRLAPVKPACIHCARRFAAVNIGAALVQFEGNVIRAQRHSDHIQACQHSGKDASESLVHLRYIHYGP